MFPTATHEDVPEIAVGGLPHNEMAAGYALVNTLQELSSYTDAFAASVLLFEHAGALEVAAHHAYKAAEKERRAPGSTWRGERGIADEHRDNSRLYREWQLLAARDAVMTLWNFGEAIIGITDLLADMHTLKAMIGGPEAIKPVIVLYNKAFSKIGRLRNAVAHAAENTASPRAMKGHASKGKLAAAKINNPNKIPIFIKGDLSGHTLIYSHSGKERSLEVSADSLAKMVEVRTAVYAAFLPAIEPLKAAALTSSGEPKSAQPKE